MSDRKTAIQDAKRQPGNFENARVEPKPRPTSRWFKGLLIAVSLSITTIYCASGGPLAVRWHDQTFPHNVSKPITASRYALCSPENAAASIYTVDGKNSRVECILVDKDRIAHTGSLADITRILEKIDDDNEVPVIRVPEGSIVVPGLSDSHCHILEYGYSRQIQLEQAKSAKEVANIVAEYVKSRPDILNNPDHVIEGWGWDHESWDVPRMPTADDFASHPLLVDRQIILAGKDGHVTWVSPRTLALNAPYPKEVVGGVIIRDKSTGEPTGVFVDTAQNLIALPPVTREVQLERFTKTVHDALSVGLTSLHDAGFKPESLEFFTRESQKKDGLPIRVYGMTFFNSTSVLSDPSGYWGDRTSQIRDADGRTKLSSRSVKIFADGALRTAGAALYEPYADDPTTSGQMRYTAEEFNHVIPRFLKDGWQVNVHAIGDRANGMVLDAFEIALKELNLSTFEGSQLRPRLEHAQVIAPKDVERVGRMGVIASVQPTHITSDMWYGEDRLGPKRVKQLYPFRDILSAGGRLTLGSDFPVENANPLNGFYAAITRLSIEGKSPQGPGGWFPDQRLTREEALRGMTIDPAYASFTEKTLGSLEPGKRADYVVLSRDIMSIPVQEVLETKVLATVIDGRVVYGGI